MKYVQNSSADDCRTPCCFSLNLPMTVSNANSFGAFYNAFTSLPNVFADI